MRNISTIICLGIGLSLTACMPSAMEEKQWTPWQITTELQEQVIELSFMANQPSLTAAQRKSIWQAKKTMASKKACYAVIDINQENAQTDKHIRSLTVYLASLGIKSQHIKIKNLAAFAKKNSELTLHLEEYEAIVPRCPGWTQAMTSDFDQEVGPGGELNFGCTTQYNLAHMIAHPRDIIEPSKLGPGVGAYLSKNVKDYIDNKMNQDSGKKAGTTTGGGDSSSN